MDPVAVATIGANIENSFEKYSKYPSGKEFDLDFMIPGEDPDDLVPYSCEGLHVVKVMEYETNDHLYDGYGNQVDVEGSKAMIIADDEGNYYVHFRGTCDGQWQYNDANYGDPPSELQTDSLRFFEEFMAEDYQGGNVYFTGHSQGGNTAQYVMINTQYGDHVDMCVSLDGPGVSNDAAETAINRYGEAYFDRQCSKMYGFYGEHDYVSPLGQQQIIPEGNVRYVENTGGDFHVVSGMMNGKSLNRLKEEGSAFRDMIVALNQKVITDLAPEDQKRAAELAMKFAEYLIGQGENGPNMRPTLTQQDLEEFKEYLFPILAEFTAEHPEMIYPALIAIGMDEGTAKMIAGIVYTIGILPDDMRLDILKALGAFIMIGEDGLIIVSEDVTKLIMGEMDLAEFLKENPLRTAALSIFLAVVVANVPLLAKYAIYVAALVTAFYVFIEGVQFLGEMIGNFVRSTLNYIQKKLEEIKEYIHSQTPGAKYVSSHPSFRADTALLRDYASRLRSVNSRVMNLDRDMNDLYWQCGFLDVLELLEANIVAGYSLRITACRNYLNTAADTLEAADRKALGYMGG